MAPREMSRRVFLERGALAAGGLLIPSWLAAACARLEPQPTPTRVPLPTPTPTETPKPIEKGTFGDWLFTPLSIKEEKESSIPEGYKRLNIQLAVKNIGTSLKGTNMFSEGSEDLLDIEFNIQATGGFSYPKEPVLNKYTGGGIRIKFPPRYSLRYFIPFIDVPLVAKDLKLVAKSKRNPNKQAIWDLEKEFLPPGQERKIEYRPTDRKDLKRLGEPLGQGPLIVTPLEAQFIARCNEISGSEWGIKIKYQVENRYGYDLGDSYAAFPVLDKEGNVRITSNSPWQSHIPKIPPGTTKNFYTEGTVGPKVKTPEDKSLWTCTLPPNFPPPPEELILLIWLPIAPKNPSTEDVWAIYDLGKPQIIK